MNDFSKKDAIYSSPLEKIVDFKFDEKVASVFADMIQRSVPGYATVISLIGVMAFQYAQPGTNCYDLGSSLGAASLSMSQRIPHPDCAIIAVDNSPDMITRSRELIDQSTDGIPIELICADINDVEIENASVVVLNYTLQFIDPDQRLQLLTRIFQGLVDKGVLILSEKLDFADETLRNEFDNLHTIFKREQGYSDLEISQKRTALENTLIRDSLETHQQRLAKAGFFSAELWFQCLNFASLIAFKS
jgi:tRNA (cmo5U34)-methyltransferase